MTSVPVNPPPRRRALVCAALASAAWCGAGAGRAGPAPARSAPEPALGGAPRGTPGTAVDRRFPMAAEYYRSGAWARAYGEFLALGNQGHAEAAAIVLFMHRMGPPLYGAYWDLGTEEQADLEQLVREGAGRRTPFVAPPVPEPRPDAVGGPLMRVARAGSAGPRC